MQTPAPATHLQKVVGTVPVSAQALYTTPVLAKEDRELGILYKFVRLPICASCRTAIPQHHYRCAKCGLFFCDKTCRLVEHGGLNRCAYGPTPTLPCRKCVRKGSLLSMCPRCFRNPVRRRTQDPSLFWSHCAWSGATAGLQTPWAPRPPMRAYSLWTGPSFFTCPIQAEDVGRGSATSCGQGGSRTGPDLQPTEAPLSGGYHAPSG
jgi:hypothetical protein